MTDLRKALLVAAGVLHLFDLLVVLLGPKDWDMTDRTKPFTSVTAGG